MATNTPALKTPRRKAGAAENLTPGKTKVVDLVTGKAKVEYYFDPTLVIQESGLETPYKSRDAVTPAKSAMKRDLSTTFASEVSYSSADDKILYSSRHLFMPCTIVKKLDRENIDEGDDAAKNAAGKDKENETPALVKTSDGELHKIRDSSKLVPLTSPEDYVGVSDVLHLPNVSEASLLHTLRIRYRRDDIYTSAGPILISVNPYKSVQCEGGDLYSDERMMLYRDRAKSAQHSGSAGLRSDGDALPCHLFEVADRAYTALLSSVMEEIEPHIEEEDPMLTLEEDHEQRRRNHTVRNQSVIISGESGAGKTEATKIIMQYLARITQTTDGTSPGKSGDSKDAATLEDRVLSSNPLLESFGNARTLRNDNSSRFGKFIRISFDTHTGVIVGATISNYLLEKTRITHQIEGERNYHIFYHILTGAGEEMLRDLGLEGGVSAFCYLGNRALQKSRRDIKGFEETSECLDRIGLSKEDQRAIFSLVAAVLHLGNVEFEEMGDASKGDGDEHSENARVTEQSSASLAKACELLGLDQQEVTDAMLTKLITVGGKTIHKPQNVAQAVDKRDALAKLAYSSLFLWLVHRINDTISTSCSSGISSDALVENGEFSPGPRPIKSKPNGASENNTGFIGVLDIYGFEHFDTNGFEQLLINYANEKLQRHFNRHLFEVEQDLYASEGVDWTYITFNDNRPCLELIEGGGGNVGILSTLDDAWGGMGSASEKDVKFVTQLHQQFGGVQQAPSTAKKKKKKKGGKKEAEANKHPNFVTPKFSNDRQFIVLHYAGEVRYTANGFVEKNVESLSNELKELGSRSNIAISKNILSMNQPCSVSEATGGRRSSIRGISVASQFRTSLQTLVADLESTQPHYIRCVKPNVNKVPNAFDSGEVLRQLRYAGMMETIRIRREGYALREEHGSFYERFHLLLHPKDAEEGEGIAHLVKVLSDRLTVTDADWQIGHSKIFLKRELANKLELLALVRVHAAARTLGRFGRFVAERRASNLLTAWGKLRVIILRKYYQRLATSIIIGSFRMHKTRQWYGAMRFAAVKIQALQRRKLAAEHVQKMRDPYGDMSFNELQNLFAEEQTRLDNAVNGKDFQTAAEIEAKMVPLKEALESKRPMTRGLLESMIEEVQKLLDDAAERKAYAECAPLQQKMETLIQKRADFPSVDELKDALKNAEANVADAANRRDFAGAAAGQAAVDTARLKLDEALAEQGIIVQASEECEPPEEVLANDADGEENGEISRFSSRAELEIKISQLTKQVKDAISNKDFKMASAVQKEVDDMEKLRELYPTVTEMETNLSAIKEEMDEAINQKDFAKAGILHDDIESLERQIADEKERMKKVQEASVGDNNGSIFIVNKTGEKLVFKTRAELDMEIHSASELVQKAANDKNFKQATEHQDTLDKLESLKESLPNLAELRVKLDETKKEMTKAISVKDFAKAGDLQDLIKDLANRVKKEEDQQKKQPPSLAKIHKAPLRPIIASAAPTSNNTPKSSRNELAQESKPESIKNDRPVSKLRPKKPMISSVEDSILSVTQMLANRRGDAALVVGANGGLAGIITDTDITRRVVAKSVDPSLSASGVMTANPKCVQMSDSAMDALGMMVENHFRHLPVVGEDGSVVGLLDIAKCLNDAISKLEHAQEKSSSAAEDAVKQMASLQGAGGTQAAALQQLLGPLMAQAFGGKSSPTLRSVLAGKPATVVSPGTNVREAGLLMAEARKAALVVDEGELIGIFGFKDMMKRCIAKELPLELTDVVSVMTPNPESVSPDMTVLEALQTMHDNKFLTLPVCESDGRVVGLVDVMDLVYASGGSEGWRSIFDSAMDVADDKSDGRSARSESQFSKKITAKAEPVIRVPEGALISGKVPDKIPTHVEIDDGIHSERESIGESLIQEMQGFSGASRGLHDTLSVADAPSQIGGASTSVGHDTLFKVVDSKGNTYRIRCESKIDSLLRAIAAKLDGVDISSIQLKFFDDEGDAVLLSSDECLYDAICLARASGSKAVKISLSLIEKQPSSKAGDEINFFILGGIGVVVAIGVAAMIALKPKSR